MEEQSRTPKGKECKYCRSELRPGASICPDCQQHQSWWKHWAQHWAQVGANLATTAGLITIAFAFFQLRESQQEHLKAAQAADKATKAEEKASRAVENLRQVSRNIVEATYIQRRTGTIGPDSPETSLRWRTAIEEIADFAEPDRFAKTNWINGLNKMFKELPE